LKLKSGPKGNNNPSMKPIFLATVFFLNSVKSETNINQDEFQADS